MLSGGVDSTYLLYRYLTQTDKPVHVHHIEYRHPQTTRGIMENIACKEITRYLQTYRPFTYSDSRYECSYQNFMGWDSDLCLLEASRCACNLEEANLITVELGWCYEDLELPHNIERVRKNVNDILWQALVNSVNERVNLNPILPKTLILDKITKQQMKDEMPPELYNMCWSCRFPKGSNPCGQCNSCKARL